MTRVRGNRDAEVSGKIIEEAGDLAKCVETQTKKNFVHRRRGEKKKNIREPVRAWSENQSETS